MSAQLTDQEKAALAAEPIGGGIPKPQRVESQSVEVEDFAEVERALDPVLTLRDGTEIPVPKIEAKTVMKMFRLSASVMDDNAEAALRLVDYADLMDTFAKAVDDDRLSDLPIEEFLEVYGDFFTILVRKLGKVKTGNPKAIVKAPRR